VVYYWTGYVIFAFDYLWLLLVIQSACEEDYQATLTAILEQSVNLSRLVDDLLLLTRAEMNQLNLEVGATKIKPLLNTEVLKWQRHHQERNISFITDLVTDDTVVIIDAPRIHQVLSILMDNATKYSPSDLPIMVSVKQNNTFIVISVKDSGKGISATEIENIFERFVRFSKHNQGLGLGLPIAKAIIEAHDGQITVESVQGEGSIFSVTLPIEQAL
jgi:two-component system OmpR family sensor kinase